jgi:hypothetical protein
LNIKAEVDALPEIKCIVQGGVGSSILSLSAVREEKAAGLVEVRSIVSPNLFRTVHLCQAKERPLTHAAEAVRQIVLRVVQNLVIQQICLGRPSSSLLPGWQNELRGSRDRTIDQTAFIPLQKRVQSAASGNRSASMRVAPS